jgi:[acyl-carrier-protein] S-malonyltransferase
MGRELAREFPTARATFEEVDAHLGMALSALCFEGPADTLQLTENAQPALLACSVAAYRVARETSDFVPAVMAGHSLGEWSALVAAGALSLGDAARGVQERGRLMQAAVPVGVGGMAAVMGLEAAAIEDMCAAAANGDVLAAANLNGAGQVVVAGHKAAVERLVTLAKERRAKAQLLAVSAPFHCALMAPAAAGVERFLAGVALAAPAVPVVSSVEGRAVDGPDDIRSLLARQVTAPVRWEATMQALALTESRLAVEFGAGRTLAGLWKRTVPAIPVLAVGEPAAVVSLREALA